MAPEEQTPRPLHELAAALARSRPDLTAPPQRFTPPDPDEIAQALSLYVRAAAAGQHADPPPQATEPDRLETEIAAAIDKRMHDPLIAYGAQCAMHDAWIERATMTDEERSVIDTTVRSAVAEFDANVQHAGSWLQEIRRERVEPEEAEFHAFQARHGLTRPPRLPSRGERSLRSLGLAAIAFTATIVAARFLGDGRGQSLAWTAPVALWSLLDVGSGAWLARHGVPALVGRGFLSKLRGLAAALAFLASTISLNLLAGHCRELFMQANGSPSIPSLLERLSTAPFLLEDVRSWVLMALGCGTSAVAAIVAAGLDDMYPGYGTVGRRLVAALKAYETEKTGCMDGLTAMRDTLLADMQAPIEALHALEQQAQAAVEARAALHGEFVEYVNQVAAVHTALCNRYREINTAVRELPAPGYFEREVPRPRFLVPAELPGLPRTPMQGWVETIAWLKHQARAVETSFAGPSEAPSRSQPEIDTPALDLVEVDSS